MNEENNANENAVKESVTLTREEALKILGLPEKADDRTVKQRYGALLRSYKQRTDEKGATYEDLAYYENISLAYDTIFGFKHDFGDDNPNSPIPYKFRRKWGKFLTVFEQYWFAFLLVAICGVLIAVFISQRIKNGKEDLIIKFVGAYQSSLNTNFTDEVNKKSKNFNNTQVTFFKCTTNTNYLDSSARSAAENFEAQLMSPGQLDVVLIDKESFEIYARKGVFVSLDEFLYGKNYDYAYKTDDSGDDDRSQILGVYVTDTTFFEGMGLEWLYDAEKGQEKTMIFAIAANSKRKEAAMTFFDELMETVK